MTSLPQIFLSFFFEEMHPRLVFVSEIALGFVRCAALVPSLVFTSDISSRALELNPGSWVTHARPVVDIIGNNGGI